MSSLDNLTLTLVVVPLDVSLIYKCTIISEVSSSDTLEIIYRLRGWFYISTKAVLFVTNQTEVRYLFCRTEAVMFLVLRQK